MNRTRNKTRPEIAQEQCGFVEGKGTTNAIYILRIVIERSIASPTRPLLMLYRLYQGF